MFGCEWAIYPYMYACRNMGEVLMLNKNKYKLIISVYEGETLWTRPI